MTDQTPITPEVTSDDKLWALLSFLLTPLIPLIVILMEDKNLESWTERLTQMAAEPDALAALRPAVRIWAERFDWHALAGRYIELYRDVLGENA